MVNMTETVRFLYSRIIKIHAFLIIFRAIYFAAYSNCKEKLNGVFDPDSTQVHMISAAMAGMNI